MLFAFILGINEDIIEVHYYKNVELLHQDLVNIVFKLSRYIGQFKKHDLIFEMAIAGPESRLLLIAFPDPHSIVGIGQIELGETPSPT